LLQCHYGKFLEELLNRRGTIAAGRGYSRPLLLLDQQRAVVYNFTNFQHFQSLAEVALFLGIEVIVRARKYSLLPFYQQLPPSYLALPSICLTLSLRSCTFLGFITLAINRFTAIIFPMRYPFLISTCISFAEERLFSKFVVTNSSGTSGFARRKSLQLNQNSDMVNKNSCCGLSSELDNSIRFNDSWYYTWRSHGVILLF
uniref:Uncharacterized protein n=1 Tax=Haemonchus placei TaxID=6290 RepID=A0A0N4W6Q9_HAEPC